MNRYACTVKHDKSGAVETIPFEARDIHDAAKKVAATGGLEILKIEDAPPPEDEGQGASASGGDAVHARARRRAIAGGDLEHAVYLGTRRALWHWSLLWTALVFVITLLAALTLRDMAGM